MKRLIALCAGVFLLPTAVSAQTLTAGPTSVNTVVTPASDYPSLKQGNAWDMDRRTDLGWHTYGTDGPLNNLTSYGFTGCTAGTVTGCSTFQFTPANTQPTLFFLDSWQPGSAPAGAIGRVKPIDTTRYKYLMVRMKFTNGVPFTSFGPPLGAPQAVIYWSRNTIYYDAAARPTGGILRSVTNGVTPGIQIDFDGLVGSEWRVYVFRLDQLGWWNQSKNAALTLESSGGRWGDAGVTADSLFFQPINYDGTTTGAVDIDWVRLTDVPTLQTISWTGGASQYDIVASPNSNCSSYTVLAENQASGFQFPFASLEPGSYFVGLRTRTDPDNSNTQNPVAVCSTGSYLVPGAATLALTSPTDEGSTDDYATTFLGNAWDFDALTDPDEIHDIGGAAITTIAAQRPDGRSLGNVRVVRGTSPAGSDSFMYFQWFNERGLDNRIDPSRYRIFTVDFGVNRSRNVNEGSIGRLIWHVNGDATRNDAGVVTRNLENVSEDLVFRHLNATTENGGVFILDRLQFDMKDRLKLPLESDTTGLFPDERSPARTGWVSSCTAPACTLTPTNPGVDGFRFDFHEFAAATDMYVSTAKLAALEQTGSSYQIAWTATVPSSGVSNPVIKLFANAVVSTATGVSNNPGFNLTPADPTCTAGTSGLTQINPVAGTALSTGTAAGTYTWTPSGFTNGTEYYICGVIEGTVNSTTVRLGETMTQFPIIVNTAYAAKPRLHFDKTALRFSGVRTAPSDPAILSSKTADQTVAITQVGSGTGTWRVGSMLDSAGGAVSYITVSPSSGSGTGRFTVSLTPHSSLPSCTAQDGLAVIIKFVSDGTTDNEPQYIRVFVTIRPQVDTPGCVAPGTIAFGAFDTPAANATGVVGAIPVTGWALDDIGVERVEIWRNCLSPVDTNRPGVCRNVTLGDAPDKVFIGNANFVPGARSDIETAFPTYPQAFRAGWGYLLLTNALPNQTSGNTEGGQGPVTLYAYAVDREGNYVALGSKAITLDNDNATVPFGAIDTPEQGGTVTAALSANFGWAMTRRQNALGVDIPKCIERTRYKVYINGVSRTLTPGTNWFPDLSRSDLAAAYPGLCDSANPLAAYYIDVPLLGLANGTHTIGWDVYDNNGTTGTQADDNVAGIGSRFFNILVASSDAPVAREASRLGQYELVMNSPRAAREVSVRVGPEEAAMAFVPVTDTGARLVRFPAGGRVMLDLGGAVDEGYQLVGEDLRALPIGSTLDAANGRFYWEPPVGFLGDFHLIFMIAGTRLDVRASVVDPMGPREVLMHIDSPLSHSTVGMGVNIAGWALDPQASAGSGIDTLHIWSQRLDDPSAKAVFLGVAVPGGARPDVAAVHGAQFGPAGFSSPTVYLMPGLYDITVYAHSRRTGRFETARTVRVTVR